MELIYRDKIIDYIRAQVSYEDMRAHIRMMMNVSTLQSFADLLHNDIKNEYVKASDVFIIRQELIFLIYREAISIKEANAIFNNIAEGASVVALKYVPEQEDDEEEEDIRQEKVDEYISNVLDQLFFMTCIELNLYRTSSSVPIQTSSSLFQYISKVFVANKRFRSYQDQKDLDTDYKKVINLKHLNGGTMPESELTPYLLNDEECIALDHIGKIMYAYTLAGSDSKPTSLKDVLNTVSVVYSDGTFQKTLKTDDDNFKLMDETSLSVENQSIFYNIKENKFVYPGKYSLLSTDKSQNEYIGQCEYFINLCQEVGKRMVSYTFN